LASPGAGFFAVLHLRQSAASPRAVQPMACSVFHAFSGVVAGTGTEPRSHSTHVAS
jgi:hypothetical protein